jgi:hypothetical protein
VPVLTVLALAAAGLFLRRDAHLLVAALGVALLATPILWPHYLVLLFVPLALVRRTFTVAWLAPLVLWLDSAAWSDSAVRIVVLFALLGAGLAWAIASSRDEGPRPTRSRRGETSPTYVLPTRT